MSTDLTNNSVDDLEKLFHFVAQSPVTHPEYIQVWSDWLDCILEAKMKVHKEEILKNGMK